MSEQGNAAAMRKALEMFVNHASCLNHCDIHRFYPETTSCDGVLADDGECPMKTECDAVFKGRAALSAPSRNCDLYPTLGEAVLASGECTAEAPSLLGMGNAQLVRFAKWLFAPAEGGAE